MRLPSRPLSAVLLAGLALAVAGCGLGDYETKMLAEQSRVERFDRDNKLLGFPLSPPTKWSEVQPAAPDLFLRPPQGVQATPSTGDPWHGLLYYYPGDGKSTTVVDRMYLAWAAGRDDVGEDVRRIYVSLDVPSKQFTSAPPPGVQPQNLTQWRLKGQFASLLYVDGSKKLAIIYQVKANYVDSQGNVNKTAMDAIGASLNTLAVGADAAKIRNEFNRRQSGAR
jgi:hypothetical protein